MWTSPDEPLTLQAPLAGWVTALDELPDPVFAGRLLGDGLAVDPFEGLLRAPAAGRVTLLHRDRYALTLRLANGAELLMHIGLETFRLGGRGFRLHVAEGATVAAGDPLVSFDMDLLARFAQSLAVPMILLGSAFHVSPLVLNRAVAAGGALFTISRGRRAA